MATRTIVSIATSTILQATASATSPASDTDPLTERGVEVRLLLLGCNTAILTIGLGAVWPLIIFLAGLSDPRPHPNTMASSKGDNNNTLYTAETKDCTSKEVAVVETAVGTRTDNQPSPSTSETSKASVKPDLIASDNAFYPWFFGVTAVYIVTVANIYISWRPDGAIAPSWYLGVVCVYTVFAMWAVVMGLGVVALAFGALCAFLRWIVRRRGRKFRWPKVQVVWVEFDVPDESEENKKKREAAKKKETEAVDV